MNEANTCRHEDCDKVYNPNTNPDSVEWFDCGECGMFTCCSRHGEKVQHAIVLQHETVCEGKFLPLGEKLARPPSLKRKLTEPSAGKKVGELSEYKKMKLVAENAAALKNNNNSLNSMGRTRRQANNLSAMDVQ